MDDFPIRVMTAYGPQLGDSKERKDKFSSEWKEGIWLGHQRGSNETLIGTSQGVVRAYSIKRREPEQRWDKEAIQGEWDTPADRSHEARLKDTHTGDLRYRERGRTDSKRITEGRTRGKKE